MSEYWPSMDGTGKAMKAAIGGLLRRCGYTAVAVGLGLMVIGFAGRMGIFRMPDYSGGVFRSPDEMDTPAQAEPEGGRYGWFFVSGLVLTGAGVIALGWNFAREAMNWGEDAVSASMSTSQTMSSPAEPWQVAPRPPSDAPAGDDMYVVTDAGVAVRCASCGASNRQSAKYCDQCGHRLT